ncbi:MAG: GAF domain-containing protein [Chloroflexi bacterium]|nr:GAF domain-containing protein [Chloroflexota bacterium]
MLPALLPDSRVRQRDYLLEISRALTEQLDLDTVLERILSAALDLLGGRAGFIALRDDDGLFRVRTPSGFNPAQVTAIEPLVRGFREPGNNDQLRLLLRDVARAAGFNWRAAVALPLTVGSEYVGLIFIFRVFEAVFTSNDRALLQSFADQAAIAIHNARLYQQATQEKRRSDAILDGSADGIMIMDAAHHIQRFNRALARMTGWSPNEAIGRTHDEIICWAIREPGPGLAEAEAGGWPLASATPLYVEGDLRRRDDGTIAVGITYAPLLGREGRLINIIASVRDITRFREAEALKSTFISIISHELKTPVSLIKGYAGTLRRKDARWDSATIEESLAVIEEESDRLADLIENLLDASRLQAGALKLTFMEISLDEVTERLVDKFRVQSPGRKFLVDFPPDFPPIQADEDRLVQVLGNLISNALKYSPEEGAITVSGRAEPERVIVSVADEGPGLPAEELPRVFDRFYRADTPATKRAQGAGLGLYLAKAVVEAHGGRLWVESEAGQGTRFLFSLPR